MANLPSTQLRRHSTPLKTTHAVGTSRASPGAGDRFQEITRGATQCAHWKRLSKATVLAALKVFFFWLAREPGFRSCLRYDDARFFNLSPKDTAIAQAHRAPRVPTIEQILSVLSVMPALTVLICEVALLAFTLLIGARDNATGAGQVQQKLPDLLFPVGGDVGAIVVDWVTLLRGRVRAERSVVSLDAVWCRCR